MNWFGAEIDGPMIATRTVHFAASAITAGALIFRTFVAEPALRVEPHAKALVDRQIRFAAWIGIAFAVASGLIWTLLLTMSLSGESLGEAIVSGALRDVLTLTQFGWVAQVRLALATVLVICLAFERWPLWRLLALVAAVTLVASIAWTGHAASTLSALGYLHLASDALHLTAASAWIGGLVPLALLLGAIRCHPGWASMELDPVRRFSTLAIVSVAALILSGLVNAWILVGSFRGTRPDRLRAAPDAQACRFRGDARVCRAQPVRLDAAARFAFRRGAARYASRALAQYFDRDCVRAFDLRRRRRARHATSCRPSREIAMRYAEAATRWPDD